MGVRAVCVASGTAVVNISFDEVANTYRGETITNAQGMIDTANALVAMSPEGFSEIAEILQTVTPQSSNYQLGRLASVLAQKGIDISKYTDASTGTQSRASTVESDPDIDGVLKSVAFETDTDMQDDETDYLQNTMTDTPHRLGDEVVYDAFVQGARKALPFFAKEQAESDAQSTEKSILAYPMSVDDLHGKQYTTAETEKYKTILDKDVYVYDGVADGEYAFTDGKAIYINANRSDVQTAVVVHELTHMLETDRLYATYKQYMFQSSMYQEYLRQRGVTHEELLEQKKKLRYAKRDKSPEIYKLRRK